MNNIFGNGLIPRSSPTFCFTTNKIEVLKFVVLVALLHALI